MKIMFDMDGTIADLYNPLKWKAKLKKIENGEVGVFNDPKPRVQPAVLNGLLRSLNEKGVTTGIITWLPFEREDSIAYPFKEWEQEKRDWAKKNFPQLAKNMKVLPYGSPKSQCIDGDIAILFDDNADVRIEWINGGGDAFEESSIIDTIAIILDQL